MKKVMASLHCYGDSDCKKVSSFYSTAVVNFFHNSCRRSWLSNLGVIPPKKSSRATLNITNHIHVVQNIYKNTMTEDQVFLAFQRKFQWTVRVLWYIFMFCYYLLFCCKINLLLSDNDENLTSAQPQINAHLE